MIWTTNHRVLAVVLVVVGLFARLVVATHAVLFAPPDHGSDASEYDSYAWNMAQGHGYRGISPDVKGPDGHLLEHASAYRVPGTSLFWAGLFRSFGHRYDVVRIAQCVLDSLTIFLIYKMGLLCFSQVVALVAAAAYAVWPTALLYSSQLGSEPLYTFLFCGFILSALKFGEAPNWLRATAAGLFLGLTMLTRGNAVLMVILVVPWAVWHFRRKTALLASALSIPLIAVVTLAPWTVRNYVRFHSFIPFETGGGDVLLGSYNRVVANDPLYHGYWVYPTSELPEYREQITGPNNELVRDRVEINLATQWIRSHPEALWYLLESRFRRAWTPFLEMRSPPLYRFGMLLSWGPVLVLFSFGFFPTAIRFLRTNNPGWILHLGILHFVLTALFFWGASRFRYPVEGLCILIAGASVAWTWERAVPQVYSRHRSHTGAMEPPNEYRERRHSYT